MMQALGSVDWILLAVLGFVGAIGTVGYSVAAPALVPALVPRDAIMAAKYATPKNGSGIPKG